MDKHLFFMLLIPVCYTGMKVLMHLYSEIQHSCAYSLPFIRIECYSGSVSCIAAIYRYSGSVSCIAAELLVEQGILIDSCISTGFNPNELIMVVPTKSNHSISPSSCFMQSYAKQASYSKVC